MINGFCYKLKWNLIVMNQRIQNNIKQAIYLKPANLINCQTISKKLEKSRIKLNLNILVGQNNSQQLYTINQKRLSKMSFKRIWTQEEDDFLNYQANLDQKRNWVKIAQIFNKTFQGAVRSPKQCRERYINHSNKNIQSEGISQWNTQSIGLLFELYEKYGPRWTFIAQLMQNKSENVVKNKFYCGLRKFIRKLNNFLKSNNKKYKKQIKYESIIRILDAIQCFLDLPSPLKKWNADIRKKIIELTLRSIKQEKFESNQIDQLTQNINKFNLQTRSYKAKKPRNYDVQQPNQSLQLSVELQNQINQKKNSIQTKQNHRSESKCHNTQPQKYLSIQNEKQFQVESHQVQDKNNISSHYLSADQIFEDFGVSLEQQDYQKHHRSSGDILDQMFPQSITFLNLQSLQ